MPQIRQVEGRNWVQPIAPADEGPKLQPCADSTSVSPARIRQEMPNALPAPLKIGISGAEPEQRAGERRPELTLGLRPSRWLVLRASAARLFEALGRDSASVQTVRA